MMKYTMLSSIETIFSIILCLSLKVGKEKTRLSGTTLRYVYRFEKNLLYNYEFGKYTKDLRYFLSLFFLPSLIVNWTIPKTSMQFYKQILLLIDFLAFIDFINTSESYHVYCLIYLIRLFRTFTIILQCISNINQSIQQYQQLNSKVPQKQQKQQELYQEQEQEQEQESLQEQQIPAIPQLEQQLSHQQNTQLQQKQKRQPMRIPGIWLILSVNTKQYIMLLLDIEKFEEIFEHTGLREQTQNMVKLHFTTQVYQSIKKIGNSKYNQICLQLIAEYLCGTLL